MIITITRIRSIPEDADPEEYFLECHTTDHNVVLFWGSVEYGSRNISTIQNQALPVSIELLDLELCFISERDEPDRVYWANRQNAHFSIDEMARIVVLSELN